MLGQNETVDATQTLQTSVDPAQISAAIQALGSALSQYQLNQINVARAQQGLPLISGQTVAPTFNVGLDSTTMQYLLIGGIAVVALLAFSKKR
jgi:hypothetical protein